jgi:RecB family exonuclease
MTWKNDKGRPINLSPSAYATWADCPRKWWYGYKERRPQRPKPATIMGSKVHAELEHYGKTGEWRPFEADTAVSVNVPQLIAEAALPHLPEVTPGEGFADEWDVEVNLTGLMCGPLPFKGIVDLGNASDPSNIRVDDFKTTSNPEFRWAKTPEQLRIHPQPCAYAYAYVKTRDLPEPESVTFRHINLSTVPYTYDKEAGVPKFACLVVEVETPWETVNEVWREMEKAAIDMAHLLETETEAEAVPVKTSACKKYGGCDYADTCPASPQNREAITYHGTNAANIPKGDEAMSKQQMDLRQRILGGKKTTTTKTSKGGGESLDALTKTIMSTDVSLPIAAVQALAKMKGIAYEDVLAAGFEEVDGFVKPVAKAKTKAKTVAKPAPKAKAKPAPKTEDQAFIAAGDADAFMYEEGYGTGVSPAKVWLKHAGYDPEADFDAFLNTINAKVLHDLVVPTDFNGTKRQAIETFLPEVAEKLKALDEIDPPEEAPKPKRKRGRPRKSEAKPKAETKPVEPAPPPKQVAKAPITERPTIYVGCRPDHGVMSFDEWVKDYETEVESRGGKVDGQFVQPLAYWNALDYGQGPKNLAALVAADLHARGPEILPPGGIFVDPRHPAAPVVVPLLLRLGGSVVRAL